MLQRLEEIQQQLSEKTVKELAAPESGNIIHYYAGHTVQGQTAPAGFGVRVTVGGSKSFILNYRIAGKERRFTIGKWKDGPTGGGWSVVAAVKHARDLRKKIDIGEDPLKQREESNAPTTGKTVSDVIDEHVERYLEKNKLRGADSVKRTLERLVKPRVGDLAISELRRKHINDMLDEIEDKHGPVMADRTLAYFRKALNWHAIRDDEFNSPIVRGMARTKPRERARTRVLTDDEIRDVWAALGTASAPYPNFIRALLFTAQRRDEVAKMRWDEIEKSGDDADWTIPAARYKTKTEQLVPLSASALAVIGEKPKKQKDDDPEPGPFVFSTTNGDHPFSGYSKAKRALDEKIAKLRKEANRDPMPPWVLHDLRRTARSLMSRAGVASDTAERVLGHAIPGVRGVYDRHQYKGEKRNALVQLAEVVDGILNPPTSNVKRRRKARKQ